MATGALNVWVINLLFPPSFHVFTPLPSVRIQNKILEFFLSAPFRQIFISKIGFSRWKWVWELAEGECSYSLRSQTSTCMRRVTSFSCQKIIVFMEIHKFYVLFMEDLEKPLHLSDYGMIVIEFGFVILNLNTVWVSVVLFFLNFKSSTESPHFESSQNDISY